MKVNSAKLKMDAGEAVFGISLNLGSPIAAELLSSSGVDFLMVDNQHGSFGQESTILTLMAINGAATPMARAAHNDYTLIGRLLDEGALGIVVPLIDTAEQARRVADACRFPPYGKRSYGWGRAGHYGSDYTTWIDEQLFVAVQIESMAAVENAEAIMATPGIDGCWIGPADLALSLGFHPNDPAAVEPGERAVERVLQACNNTGKIAGYATWSAADAVARAAQGYRFLTAGIDVVLLESGAVATMKQIRAGLR